MVVVTGSTSKGRSLVFPATPSGVLAAALGLAAALAVLARLRFRD